MIIQGKRERNKIQCRERILATSRRMFTSGGYEETTIEEIAESAEISKATLYNYFPSKEILLVGIADAALEELRNLLETELREETDCLRKLRRILEELMLDTMRYLALTRRILALNVCPESPLHVTRVELLEILSQLTEQAQKAGQLRRDLPLEELTDSFLQIYLMAAFGWEDLGSSTEEACRKRMDRAFDRLLLGIGVQRGSI